MSDEDFLYIQVRNAQSKYLKLLISGIVTTLGGIIFIIYAFTKFSHDGVYESDQPSLKQILPLVLFFIPAFGLQQIRNCWSERNLYLRGAMDGLLIDEKGIKGPLVLLEGPTRDKLRDNHQPVFFIPWSKVEAFVLEPQRGTKVHGSPPYYKIAIEGGEQSLQSSYFILRNDLKDREQDIVSEIKKYLDDDKFIFNDAIYEDDKEKEK
ncbi:MAG: hypothetical protein KTR28_03960 [Micavibrio sp.]|nr:hypothetical protein [Micavibrio sp.]